MRRFRVWEVSLLGLAACVIVIYLLVCFLGDDIPPLVRVPIVIGGGALGALVACVEGLTILGILAALGYAVYQAVRAGLRAGRPES